MRVLKFSMFIEEETKTAFFCKSMLETANIPAPKRKMGRISRYRFFEDNHIISGKRLGGGKIVRNIATSPVGSNPSRGVKMANCITAVRKAEVDNSEAVPSFFSEVEVIVETAKTRKIRVKGDSFSKDRGIGEIIEKKVG